MTENLAKSATGVEGLRHLEKPAAAQSSPPGGPSNLKGLVIERRDMIAAIGVLQAARVRFR
jgi:hypothetical protein